ncbi:MAG: stage III sporulation protein AF [Oscillospiraceae bacterium]|nr:stage III sporulation protein AF [Oscillospiraceae bacterium]
MDVIRDWALAVCFTAVGGAVFSILTPRSGNGMDRLIRFVCSLFFLSAVISPFVTGSADFDFGWIISGSNITEMTSADTGFYTGTASIKEDTPLDQGIREQTKTAVESDLRARIVDLLQYNGLNAEKIEIIVNINEDDSILITRLALYTSSSRIADIKKLKEMLKKEVGIEPEVILQDEIMVQDGK